MAINAFDAGLLGLQRGFQTVNNAAGNIAGHTSGFEANGARGAEAADLTQELVSQRIGQRQTEASAQVVKAADETLGTLIDLFV